MPVHIVVLSFNQYQKIMNLGVKNKMRGGLPPWGKPSGG